MNILVSGFNHQLSLSQLADLGVRRISVGSGLALAAWGTFLRAAKDIKANGTFNLLANNAAISRSKPIVSGKIMIRRGPEPAFHHFAIGICIR